MQSSSPRHATKMNRSSRRRERAQISASIFVAVGAILGVLLSRAFLPRSTAPNETEFMVDNVSFFMEKENPRQGAKLIIETISNQQDILLLSDLQFDRTSVRSVETPSITIRAETQLSQPPNGREKTFFVNGWKETHPMIRALRNLGWTRVNSVSDARFVYFYEGWRSLRDNITEPWQRSFWMYQTFDWWDTALVYETLSKYKIRRNDTSVQTHTFRETFSLEDKYDIKRLKNIVSSKESRESFLSQPWILKEPDLMHPDNVALNINATEGIRRLGANSKDLRKFLSDPVAYVYANLTSNYTDLQPTTEGNPIKTLLSVASNLTLNSSGVDELPMPKSILQSYVCNELRWSDQRPFTLRTFWFVASLNPLIVFYTDGYVRIDESLEYRYGQVPTIQEFSWDYQYEAFTDAFPMKDLEKLVTTEGLNHIRQQMMHTIGVLSAAFHDIAFTPYPDGPQDASQFFAADFLIDQDFSVKFLRTVEEPILDEDHYFQLEVNHEIFHGIARILGHVWDKQVSGQDIFPIKHQAPWQVVYAANKHKTFQFEYNNSRLMMGSMASSCDFPQTTTL